MVFYLNSLTLAKCFTYCALVLQTVRKLSVNYTICINIYIKFEQSLKRHFLYG